MTIDFLHHLYFLGKLALCLLFVLLCICIPFYLFCKEVFRVLGVRRWRTADGSIAQSKIDLLDSYDGDPADAPEDYKFPSIEYIFWAGGKEYRSRKIKIVPYKSPGLGAGELIARYPQGSKVTVYYNPSDPSDCALETKLTKEVVRQCGWFLLGYLIVGLAIYFAYQPFIGWLREVG